jgi:lipopolysaccharide transport system permease protein
VREEVEELEDDAYVSPAVERPIPVRHRGDVPAADEDRPGGGRVDPGDEVEERGLAASRRPDHREELAGRYGEVDGVQGNDRLRSRVGFRDPLADDRGRRRRRRARIRRRHAAEDIGYLSRLLSPFHRIWRQRALVVALARRELQARYRGGALGFLWSFLNPLLLLLVYATVFRVVFAPRADVRPYALFLFGGVLCWGFVSASLADAAETFRANGPLLRKTTVAPEVFPAVAVGARLAHLGLALPVLAGAIAVSAALGAVRPDVSAAQFPLVLLLLAAMTAGVALLVSALSVHFGDVRDLLGNLLTLTFFLTPVLYPLEAVPDRMRVLLWLNPFTPFFAAIHDSVFYFRAVGAGTWAGMILWTFASLAAGGAVFERLRDSIAEEA